MTDREQIAALLNRINNAWKNGPAPNMTGTIGACFDEDMVIAGGPGMEVRSKGRADCANSYASFLKICTLQECELAPPSIHVNDTVAVATCPWKMTYEHDGQIHRESGHDLFVFSRVTGEWLAVWRSMIGT